VALVDSLLSAIVRADGDALVMHVGERPYVVVGTQTINISTHGLNLEAMTGMLAQLLPADAQTQLEEFGAVEHRLTPPGEDRFTVVAARGGDDIWIEIRRRRAPAAVVAPAPVVATAPVMQPESPVEAPPPVFEPPVPVAETTQPATIEAAVPESAVPEHGHPVESAESLTSPVETPEPQSVVINAQLEQVVVVSPQTEVIVAVISEPEPATDAVPPPSHEPVAESEPPPVAAAMPAMPALEEVAPAHAIDVIEWPAADEVAVTAPAVDESPEPIAQVEPPRVQEVPEPSVPQAIEEKILEPVA